MRAVVFGALILCVLGGIHMAAYDQPDQFRRFRDQAPAFVPEAAPRYSQRAVPPATYQTLLFRSPYDQALFKNRKRWI